MLDDIFFLLLQGIQLEYLKYINLSGCESITELPELCTPRLEELYLSHCKNLVKVHKSVGFLDKLQYWDLVGCEKLQILPNYLKLISLKHINLKNCESIVELPEFHTPSLEKLYLSHSKNLVKVHELVGFLDKLQIWELEGCGKLQILPNYLRLISLKYFNLNNCESITELPEFCTPSLMVLCLSHCKNLVKVHESVGFLDKLKYWDLEGCEKLQILPNNLRLISLKYINLNNCESITELPEFCTPRLNKLYLSHCKNLVKIHESVGFLAKLQEWDLKGCGKLQILPNYLKLISLKYINLNNCESITKLPEFCTPRLEKLFLSHCKNLVEVHESVGFLDCLQFWDLEGCEKLRILPKELKLQYLQEFRLIDCSRLKKFPNIHPKMEYLRNLNLRGSGIRKLPSSIKYLVGLRELDLMDCKNLIYLPDDIYNLKSIDKLIIPTAKLRKTHDYLDGFCGFLKLDSLDFRGNKNIVELDLLMKPKYFPVLKDLNLSETNIVSIPESLSRFAKLEVLNIRDCKQLQEISRLPQSVRDVDLSNCYSLNAQSSNRLLNQVSLSLFFFLFIYLFIKKIFVTFFPNSIC